MKRIIQKEIESCHECHLLKKICGYSSYLLRCDIMGYTNRVSNSENSLIANKRLELWFKKCPVWKEIEC